MPPKVLPRSAKDWSWECRSLVCKMVRLKPPVFWASVCGRATVRRAPVMSIRSNKKGLSLGATALLSLLFGFFAPTIFSPKLPCSSVYAQVPAKVRSITCDFVPEGGCPVEPTAIRCELDVDPFDAPMDARVYVDYKNNSDRPV